MTPKMKKNLRIWCCSTDLYRPDDILMKEYQSPSRYYVVGHTGPTPDNQILEESKTLKEPDKFFSMLQYLLSDAGYALEVYVCTPHR
jgi:hypothetical protein